MAIIDNSSLTIPNKWNWSRSNCVYIAWNLNDSLQIIAKGMIAGGKGGSIVNISSLAAKVGLDHHAVYCKSINFLCLFAKILLLLRLWVRVKVTTVLQPSYICFRSVFLTVHRMSNFTSCCTASELITERSHLSLDHILIFRSWFLQFLEHSLCI